MDSTEGNGIDGINSMVDSTDARDTKSFIVMVAVTLVATALVLGMMWMNNLRHEGASSRVVAEQQLR